MDVSTRKPLTGYDIKFDMEISEETPDYFKRLASWLKRQGFHVIAEAVLEQEPTKSEIDTAKAHGRKRFELALTIREAPLKRMFDDMELFRSDYHRLPRCLCNCGRRVTQLGNDYVSGHQNTPKD